MSKLEKVVLAYSGGLDTSIILKWIKNNYDCDVVCMTADLGQGEEMDGIEQKALTTGAVKAYVEDLREEFVRDYVFPMFRASALYEGRYLLGTAIARPLIAKRMVEIAEVEGAQAVAHGATGKGNDQVRFELATMALNPRLKTIAPWREWDMKSRTDLINYAKENSIPVPVSRAKPWSIDANLLHTSFEGGELEDPWNSPGQDCHRTVTPLEKCPDQAEEITIDFERGNPVAVNDIRYSPAALLAKLNELGGRHGIGRVDMVENRFVGMKSRGVYETPGGTILAAAHRDLEGLTMDREMMHLRDGLIPRYAEMVYYGYWFSPEREALQAMVDKSQEKVTGTVRVKLYKGNCVPLGRKSPFSMYNADLATFEEDYVYDQSDAAGFIKLVGLRLKGRMQQSKFGGKDVEDSCE
ncbi:MAG: argininosuccinate synthase [Pseudodesulfovibrio sp.]|uniref:Argininosuccinate synthase n=1 Tax=Pseudodesulfovibrio aespoeensis (strain ATCC 700646 / DSM 10631 / Aspo-2) TaxID=643562 RepID=E6VUM6_PSEA9|nr:MULTISPECIES: argininosuccinate synthase [Pseudodesulfovibrio]MBU4193286.1 argininosuccinate synthase [Pseudomonadota bacterium]ADU62267.1 argininosuccinate synthase [Pseudodesulfovibrio aespoeensis Aspo-2]MBU4243317.1 argininosuccinate synthase [Pseudomonadota bacterium]MBU4474068.1 argininosuccinate synthase [Pseudomonadota bacterium]MBU4515266.1 argininosuccinate synthase [Pseudomonadota bacterium]